MGLDMYLTASRYVENWNFQTPDQRHEVTVKRGGKIIKPPFPVSYVRYAAGYWRKANQIHNWFVKNVQDGKDNCQEYYVGKEDLQKLLDVVSEALETRDASLLPPTEGVFFGSTEIDESYWQDLEDTKEILEKAIAAEGLEFSYRSSW